MMKSRLSNFLSAQRKRYLEDLATGKGKRWTVAMGNEAGDLDSAASSIAFSYLQSTSTSPTTSDLDIIPLILTNRQDIILRPENEHAFKEASLDPERDLLCLNDIPEHPFPSNKFVLFDHNRLLERFKSPDAKVVGIIDHHEDEGFHLDANPRKIQIPTGSCASLVVDHFRESNSWTSELAKLMLSAIVLDTGGLKPAGKATQTDEAAARFLLPLAKDSLDLDSEGELHVLLGPLAADLLTKKSNVSHLSNRDLLRRDYKQYYYSWGDTSACHLGITVGLSTVPVDLKEWVHKDPFSLHQWMTERGLLIHGSLTTFRRVGKSGKTKHKRQQLWVLREDIPEELEIQFWRGLEADKELELENMKNFELKLGVRALVDAKLRIRAYKQGNAHATRKVTAPLVKKIVEGYLDAL